MYNIDTRGLSAEEAAIATQFAGAFTRFDESLRADFRKDIIGINSEITKLKQMGVSFPLGGGNARSNSSLGARIVKSAQFKAFTTGGARGTCHIQLDGRVSKAIIVSDGVTGLRGATEFDSTEALPTPATTLLDIIPSRQLSGDSLSFNRQKPPLPTAAIQVNQGDQKAESALDFENVVLPVETLALWQPASLQALADIDSLELIIDSDLVAAVRALEEKEVLLGDGSSGHLHGILPQATALPAGVTGDTMLDIIAKGVGALVAAGVRVNAVVVSSADWLAATLLKTVNGEYLLGEPASAVPQQLWGIRLVVSASMPAGQYLAGDFTKAQLRYREQVNVAISTEHLDYFTKNLCAIRCEERMLVAVRMPSAFGKGSVVITP